MNGETHAEQIITLLLERPGLDDDEIAAVTHRLPASNR
jgi:hypothetical protein